MIDYNSLKVAELKDELKNRGLVVTGKKSELVARLEEHDKEQAGSEPIVEGGDAATETAQAPQQPQEAAAEENIVAEEEPAKEQQEAAAPAAPAAEAPVEADATMEEADQPAATTTTTGATKRKAEDGPDEGTEAPLAKQSRPVAAPVAQHPSSEPQPSRALLIEGFVRPFTLNAAQTLLNKSGTVLHMWMPAIKNVAWCVYATRAEAAAAVEALTDLQWPAGSPKTLKPKYVPLVQAESVIAAGNSSPDFKIERTAEDGPEDEIMPIIEEEPQQQQQRQKKQKQENKKGKDDVPTTTTAAAAAEQVEDLRELLNRRASSGKALAAAAAAAGNGQGGVVAAAEAAADARAARAVDASAPKSLDDLFRKTEAKPAIYWKPVHDRMVEERQRKREKAEAQTGGRGGANEGRARRDY